MKEIKNAWWDYFSILGSQAVALPLSIVYISLVARIFGPEKWGTVALFLGVMQLLFCSGIGWTSGAIVRFGKDEFIKRGNLRLTSGSRILISAICFIFVSLAALVFRRQLTGYIGLPRNAFWLILTMLVIYSLSDHLTWMLKATGRMKHFAVSSAIRQAGLVIFILTAILIPVKKTAFVIINFEIYSYLAVIVFCLVSLRIKFFLPIEANAKMLSAILAYCWPSFLIFLLGYASNWMDYYFIRHFLDSASVGVYQAAYRLTQYIITPLMGITFLSFPLLMSLRVKGRQDLVRLYLVRLTPQVAFFWSSIVSLIIACGYLIIRAVFGESFNAASVPFVILLAGIGFQVLSIMYTSIFAVFDWLAYNSLILLIMCLINFFGDLLLIPRMGISGAAVAASISYAVSSVLYLTVANNLISLKARAALFYPLAGVLALAVVFSTGSTIIRIPAILAIIFVFALLTKKNRVFSVSDTVMLKKISMPVFLRSFLTRVYQLLS